MRGDGLHKIPKSRFWYYKRKENGRWRGISTKTSNYGKAKRVRRKALQDQEEGPLAARARLPRWPFERASVAIPAGRLSTRRTSRAASGRSGCFPARAQRRLFGRVACERDRPNAHPANCRLP